MVLFQGSISLSTKKIHRNNCTIANNATEKYVFSNFFVTLKKKSSSSVLSTLAQLPLINVPCVLGTEKYVEGKSIFSFHNNVVMLRARYHTYMWSILLLSQIFQQKLQNKLLLLCLPYHMLSCLFKWHVCVPYPLLHRSGSWTMIISTILIATVHALSSSSNWINPQTHPL